MPPSITAPLLQFAIVPDRMIMAIDGLSKPDAKSLAIDAVWRARHKFPRVTGRTTRRFEPIYGRNFFGIYFPDSYVWFHEHGSKPFTMNSLAGKTIPMWVSDEDGSLRAKNPKIKTMRTEDGRLRVLIFRRAAQMGQRKVVRRTSRVTGAVQTVSVPASYPGAPGRISSRARGLPDTPVGQYRGGQILPGNGGVRWRHPGLRGMQFINSALAETAFVSGLLIQTVYALDSLTWSQIMRKVEV